MTGLKATIGVFLLGFASQGSTCHGQAGASGSGPGEAAKETTTTQADVTLAGVDTSTLTPREKKEWSSYVSELLAPCSDVPVPIAQCVTEKRNCTKCVAAAKFVAKGVRDGLSRDQIEKSYHGRFDADRIKNVAIDDSPSKGPASAPVTIVEFADFECPFCAMEAPVLEKAWNEHRGSVRFVYKYFPLSGHPHGEIAARAAIAAAMQGKFWEMHDKLFSNREHLEQSDLEGYAKELGLDVVKFRTDAQSQAATDRIARDKKTAESLDVKGTPTIYINGRDYDPKQDLNDWLALELTGAGVDPKPEAAPAAPASGSSSGGADAAKVAAPGKK
jgi:protein-disulfide isomerase